MIRVTFWQGKDGNLRGFTVTGHAGYRIKGEDIVCAAVSALAQTTVLSLQEHLRYLEKENKEPVVTLREGDLQCLVPDGLSPAGAGTAGVILRTLEIGLQAIATDYAQHVRVEYKKYKTADCGKLTQGS
ncbi:ribosomal-processing cysteine protease Prp [Moorella naiadis]|uniref:ribosomal-processing cysteine protease Prp n=1 Tax=Moorella naiadis (nom. illeg.) TaxID=3093670 RepID=UPI003D9C957F